MRDEGDLDYVSDKVRELLVQLDLLVVLLDALFRAVLLVRLVAPNTWSALEVALCLCSRQRS